MLTIRKVDEENLRAQQLQEQASVSGKVRLLEATISPIVFILTHRTKRTI